MYALPGSMLQIPLARLHAIAGDEFTSARRRWSEEHCHLDGSHEGGTDVQGTGRRTGQVHWPEAQLQLASEHWSQPMLIDGWNLRCLELWLVDVRVACFLAM